MSSADLFALPTLGENFGHAIAEALAVGCPIAVPQTTIWTSLAEQCGYLVESADQIADAVHDLANQSAHERLARRECTWSTYRRFLEGEAGRESLFQAAVLAQI